MKNLAKTLAGTVAAGAMAISTASPALARDRNDIDAGDVVAGALVVGGIAAVAAAASDNDRYGYRYDDYRYGRDRYRHGYGNQRGAVDQCVRVAENEASRFSHGRAHVTRVTGVSNKRNGFDVRGRIAVDDRGYRWRRSGYDTGTFTCKVRYGRIADIDFSGIRGLR